MNRKTVDEAPAVAVVAETGDRRATLIALRDHVARKIDTDPGARDLAPLVRQLVALVVEIDATPDPAKPDILDQLAARRRARRSPPATDNPESRKDTNP